MSKKVKEPTIEEQKELIEILKFTPRTYTVCLWGYGGEKVMGTVSREIYDYFKKRRLDLSEYAWDSDYADEHNIPEEMQPFPPGSWYECDGMAHVNGVSMDAGTIQVNDENNDTVYERSLEDCNGCDDSPSLSCGDEAWIDMEDPGTIVFIGNSHEKGTFFEGEINLKMPFDIEKLEINTDDVDGEEIVTSVYYDGEEIENYGGSTDGKSSDFGFYVAGSNKQDGKGYEKYRNMDDIEYPLTDWFPKKINPAREGVYTIRTAGKNSYTHPGLWTGEKWTSTYNDSELKIKEWQGIAIDPDGE